MATFSLHGQRITDDNLIASKPILQKRASVFDIANVSPQRPAGTITCVVNGITITSAGSIYLP